MAGSRGDWLDVICPYLRAADGTWRSAVPAREHRCWAFEPVIELPGLTQQRLCLTQTHTGCERFLHAQERRAAALARDHIAPERVESARFGPFVSPVPLAIERAASGGEGSGRTSRYGRDRLPLLLLGGAAIVILLAAAVILLGGFLGSPSLTGLASATPVVTHATATQAGPTAASLAPLSTSPASPSATPFAPSPTPGQVTPSPTPTPVVASRAPSAGPPSSAPTPSEPLPSALPVAGQRYRVKDGDKLPALALKFGVSVRAIKQANDLGEPPVLVPGSFIIIPNPPSSPPA